mgnify:CR=1 FL=1
MEKPYIFDDIVYTSNNRFKRLKINKSTNIKVIKNDNKRQEKSPTFYISKKIKIN